LSKILQSIEEYLASPRYISDREQLRRFYLAIDGAALDDSTLRGELIQDFCLALDADGKKEADAIFSKSKRT
jgi:hypothetical protein